MPEVIDTNRDLTPAVIARVKAAGVRTIIGYLTTNTAGEKIVTPVEAQRVADAGLRLGLVFEVYGGVGNFSHNDINTVNGLAHASFANRWAPLVGAPAGSVIWFAIDTDATTSQINALVVPYFKAIKATLDPKYRVGVYGCGAVCAVTLDNGSASVAWLSNAMGWNGSRAFLASGRHSLLQKLPAIIASIDTDPDVINPLKPDIGDFIPFAEAPAPPEPGPLVIPMTPVNIAQLQRDLNRLPTTLPPLDADGDFGNKTFTACVLAVKDALARTSIA